jgi:hypothetical protein
LYNLVEASKILEKGIKKRKPVAKPRSHLKKSETYKQGPVGGMHLSASVGTLGSLDTDPTGILMSRLK